MRGSGTRILLLISAVALFSLPIYSQGYPKAEFFGGFQLMHESDLNLPGFRADFARNFGPAFGLAGEFSFGKTSKSEEGSLDSTKEFTFLAGPRFSYRASRFRLFGQVLAGLARLNLDREDQGRQFPMWSHTGFAASAGLGFEFNINDTISLRPMQFDWLGARFYGHGDGHTIDWANQLRYSAGIVLKFGHSKK